MLFILSLSSLNYQATSIHLGVVTKRHSAAETMDLLMKTVSYPCYADVGNKSWGQGYPLLPQHGHVSLIVDKQAYSCDFG